MSLGLENLGMLLGLGALAIPVLIHFLQRRRYDVVDWGAMQFLQVAPSVRRRWWWDELLLLLIRMGMLAVLVFALGSPFLQGPWVRHLLGQARRDVVFILDNSASMTRGQTGERAREWVRQALGRMRPGDQVGLILAGQPAKALTPEMTSNLFLVLKMLDEMAAPAGTSDIPHAVELARDLLARLEEKSSKQIYLLRDRQRNGWTDAQTMESWERLSSSGPGKNDLKLTLVRMDEEATGNARNFWLAPLHSELQVAAPGQKAIIASELHWQGEGEMPSKATFSARVDEVVVKRWNVPLAGVKSPLPVPFSVQLEEAGSRLISLEIELGPDADALAADNEQHLVLEAVKGLRVLLVDGNDVLSPEGSTYFLNNALAEKEKGKGVFSVTRTPYDKLSAELLFEAAENRFRVLVLADLPGLTDAQGEAVERFLRQGGSVLLGLGPRSLKHAASYRRLHQDGLGWFPLRIEEAQSQEAKLEQAARILVPGPSHPALDYFRDPVRGLSQARFPRWVAVSAAEGATAIAFLDVGQPFLIEAKVGPGRVIVSTLPLDRSWGSDFPSVHAYPILVHRLSLYLAETGNVRWRLLPGERATWQPAQGERVELPATLYWQERGELPHAFNSERWPWVSPEVNRPGPSSLSWGLGKKTWFVAPWDVRESDLALIAKEEEDSLARLIPVRELDSGMETFEGDQDGGTESVDIWWILLLAVVCFLCLEIWFTSRIAKQQASV